MEKCGQKIGETDSGLDSEVKKGARIKIEDRRSLEKESRDFSR